ncbi:MAG: diguanylate cyclase [Thiomicrorhabdus sp.]|nr:MAG: diguanylate cyclase [Thiomicrorhabdus sp.]
MVESTLTLKDLENALRNGEFIFYYQPKISMITGKIIGAEALIRWKKPNGDLVMPGNFIPLAESTGYISKITTAMLDELIIDMTIFQDTQPGITISINACSKDFDHPLFIDNIKFAIDTHQLDPNHLEVELTESTLLEESGYAHQNFSKLVDMGVPLVMDDFGTGFSSIDMLSKLPFSAVKLDQGVVSRMEQSEKNQTIVESTIRMGHQLGFDVVAEGIETEEVYQTLQNAGCTIAQGYWISHPLPFLDFLDFIRQDKRWPSTAVGLLYMAELDHIQWRKSLFDGVFSLKNRKTEGFGFRGKPASDSTSCMLGKWYYGAGREYCNLEAYIALEEPHKQLHDQGNDLIKAVEKGASKEEVTGRMRELSMLSGVIIQLLQDIENEIM